MYISNVTVSTPYEKQTLWLNFIDVGIQMSDSIVIQLILVDLA